MPSVSNKPFPDGLRRHGGRVMLFVDGENMAARYKEARCNAKIVDHVVEIPDVFVWSTVVNKFLENLNIIRSYYFTSAMGDDHDYLLLQDGTLAYNPFAQVPNAAQLALGSQIVDAPAHGAAM